MPFVLRRAGERGTLKLQNPNQGNLFPIGKSLSDETNTNSTDEKITDDDDENHISTDANHKMPGVSAYNYHLFNQANAGHATTQTPRMERPRGDISAFNRQFQRR